MEEIVDLGHVVVFSSVREDGRLITGDGRPAARPPSSGVLRSELGGAMSHNTKSIEE